MDFVELHVFVGHAALEGERLPVELELAGQALEFLEEQLFVFGVVLDLQGERSVFVPELPLRLLVDEWLVDQNQLKLLDILLSAEVELLL